VPKACYYSLSAWNCRIIFIACLTLDLRSVHLQRTCTFLRLSCLPPIDHYPDLVISPDSRANLSEKAASWMINVRSDLWWTTFNIYWSLITWKRPASEMQKGDKLRKKKNALVQWHFLCVLSVSSFFQHFIWRILT